MNIGPEAAHAPVHPGFTRRQLLLGGAAIAGITVLGVELEYKALTGEQPQVDPIDPAHFGYYGMLAQIKLQEKYGIHDKARSGLYYTDINGREVAKNWAFSHAFAASLDSAGVTLAPQNHRDSVVASISGLEHYESIDPASGLFGYQAKIRQVKPKDDIYFDDNAHNGANLLRAGRQLQDEEFIDLGKAVYQFILTGSSGSESCANGPLVWGKSRGKNMPDINTVQNAATAVMGMMIYKIGGQQEPIYLDTALPLFEWTKKRMQDPRDGLYWDRLDKHCETNTVKWSYNQGLMIGANLLLHEFTGAHNYLSDAESIARASLRLYAKNGKTDLQGQPIEFNTIYLRNMLQLSVKTRDPDLRSAINTTAQEYAQQIWPKFFIHNKYISFYDSYPLIKQAAIVEIISMLGWATDQYDLLV